MSIARTVKFFTVNQIESSCWLPDGQVARFFLAHDEEGRVLPGTYSSHADWCREYAEGLFPGAVFVAAERRVAPEGRL